jgi:hypothetical protein
MVPAMRKWLFWLLSMPFVLTGIFLWAFVFCALAVPLHWIGVRHVGYWLLDGGNAFGSWYGKRIPGGS